MRSYNLLGSTLNSRLMVATKWDKDPAPESYYLVGRGQDKNECKIHCLYVLKGNNSR